MLKRPALWVFLLALGARLLYLGQIQASPLFRQPVVDAETYTQHAERLAGGNWLGQGEGPFWQPPLYPYFLGAVKWGFADSFFGAARLFQAALGALSCALLWWVGCRVFRPAVGLIAALAAALYGPLIFFDGELLPATLATFLDLAGLALLLWGIRRPAAWRFAIAGGLLGLAALAVPTVLVFVATAAGWMAWKHRGQGRRWAGLFLAGAALAIAPVTLRNYFVGKDAVLISYNSGVNFYLGNNPHYDRLLNLRPGWEWDELVGLPLEAGILQPSRKAQFFFVKAWDYIRTQPLDWLGLLGRKTLQFWRGDEPGRNQDIYYWRNYSWLLGAVLWKGVIAFPFGLVGPLALAGLLLALRQQGLSLVVVFAGAYALGVIAFFPAARYRIPAIPVLLLFAAHGACWIGLHLARRQWRPALIGWVGFGGLALAGNWRLAPMNMGGDAAIHYNLGNAYAQQRRAAEARREFALAVEMDSTYWQAWLNLGSMQAVQGQMQEAARSFEKVTAAEPERAEAWVNLARARRALGESPTAQRAYQEALRTSRGSAPLYAELIGFHLQAGDFAAAAQALQQACQAHPQEAKSLRQAYEAMQARVLGQR